ncbi:putative immunity protein [Niabella beijingensis]|uniref:putative immunity protein n=1 Tax=Niabella beijingensis TaxID=2872700 RepID=UPI001CBCF656|nr:hypothetical protein [Niabella beijingensis]MBZ4188351.1 hypothetical protein [Niabella beijingensis]
MRNKKFVTEQRGGTLALKDHRGLMNWAIACSEHVLLLVQDPPIDNRLTYALSVAKEWEKGKVKTGSAMKAARDAHASARDTANPILKSVARSIGQAVATAHMADHSVGAALYALQAVLQAGKSVDDEKAWQDEKMKNLPQEIINLLKETRSEKKQGFKDLRD